VKEVILGSTSLSAVTLEVVFVALVTLKVSSAIGLVMVMSAWMEVSSLSMALSS